MATVDHEGAILYQYPDDPGDILFNGVSVNSEHPVAIKIWPDGWGWVLLEVDPTTSLPNMWVDGQYQSYFKWGYIQLLENNHQPAYLSGIFEPSRAPSYLEGQ